MILMILPVLLICSVLSGHLFGSFFLLLRGILLMLDLFFLLRRKTVLGSLSFKDRKDLVVEVLLAYIKEVSFLVDPAAIVAEVCTQAWYVSRCFPTARQYLEQQ
jgi:hypothetical protein